MISSEDEKKDYEDCKSKLEKFYDEDTKGLMIRSKVDWYEKGEKSNAYFYNLEKRNKTCEKLLN